MQQQQPSHAAAAPRREVPTQRQTLRRTCLSIYPDPAPPGPPGTCAGG
eukprot:COSAG01_NODE_19073_length_1032_cov_1.467310_1_plen_47_part_10